MLNVLGGSWAVISGVISRVTIVITHIGGLITLLITTHEPPSRGGVITGIGVWLAVSCYKTVSKSTTVDDINPALRITKNIP